jgi:hypothetical protein
VARPDLMPRLAVLSADTRWRRLAHDVLLDVVHHFRTLIARWSALLLTTEESLRALNDLAEQAEELSMLFVEFDGHRPTSGFVGDQLQERLLLWSRAFANAVSLEEETKAASASPLPGRSQYQVDRLTPGTTVSLASTPPPDRTACPDPLLGPATTAGRLPSPVTIRCHPPPG